MSVNSTSSSTPITALALPLPIGAAQDGADISAPTAMPAGGSGIRGWLSAIWTKLNGSLAVTGTFWQATQPVSLATNTPDVIDRAARLLGVVAQGTAAALASAWPFKITDGTTAVKVTVGSAQPASTDGALLVNAIDTFAGTALASASRGVATVNTDILNYNGKGIRVWQDLTVLGASSVCTFSIQEKDPVSGKFITILASAATGVGINAIGTAKLTVYPGLTAAANSVASDVVPANIRIVSTVATAASTFSIGYSIIP